MKTAVFSTKPYDAKFLVAANANVGHELDFFEEKLSPHTAKLAEGHTAICAFVNDILNARTLDVLDRQNVRFVALRCAGFNQVDLRYASSLGIKIAHVPAYSPYAVAEFALALVLALNRRIHRAYNRVRDGNFSIDGLLGFDLHEKTVGVVGTRKIGRFSAWSHFPSQRKFLANLLAEFLHIRSCASPTIKNRASGTRLKTLAAALTNIRCPFSGRSIAIVPKSGELGGIPNSARNPAPSSAG